jgi:hypothetical protein
MRFDLCGVFIYRALHKFLPATLPLLVITVQNTGFNLVCRPEKYQRQIGGDTTFRLLACWCWLLLSAQALMLLYD